MGHVVRCLALADELRDNHECKIYFAMRKSELGIEKVKQSYPVLNSDEIDKSSDYEKWLVDCAKKTKANMLILDVRDGLLRTTIRSLKKSLGIKIVTIDDTEGKRLETDIAFYPPVPQLKEYDWKGFRGSLFSGWEYVLIRNEFFRTYPRSSRAIPDIMISMGGTDPNNMTLFVIEALKEIKASFSVSLILGLGYSFHDILLENLSGTPFGYKIHKEPGNIPEIMSTSDMAIISFGVTAYELAALGVPSILLSLTQDHFRSASIFAAEGIGINLGVYTTALKTDLIRAVTGLLKEGELRKNMSQKAVSLFTGSNLRIISNKIFDHAT